MSSRLAACAFVVLFVQVSAAAAIDDDHLSRQEVADVMRRATTYFRHTVATHGGYVYYYSLDLDRRWGEGEATRDQIWVQPPGTPTVGMAYLRAHEATGDASYLDAARQAAEALVYGQLESGGWTNCVDFDPRGRRRARYRAGKGRGKNNSSLDDGQSQSAMRLLMRVDRALDFKNRAIHRSIQAALDALLAAQFPCGGFPQIWTGPVVAQPIVRANYPEGDWRTDGRIKNYWDMYTLNDGLAGTVADTLIEAHRIYGSETFLAALKRLGDFLVLSQMPDPQPAWAQQYNYRMQPIWARRFEPAAISGYESQDVLRTLLKICGHTGDEKYLAPVPRALRYLRRSLLEDGRIARFYELRSNRPLYMTRKGKIYSLTYDDSNLPRHYGWKMPARLDEIEAQYRRLKRGRRAPGRTASPSQLELESRARRIVQSLDSEGRWVSTYTGQALVGQPKFDRDTRFVSSEVFSRNLEGLAEYLIATRKP